MYKFASDNASVVHPKIMEALSTCNEDYAPPYGADSISAELNKVYSDLFEHEVFVFPVSSGTAANGLALAALTPSYGTVFCHRLAHILVSEAGAPEFHTGGCRLVQLDGELCKIAPQALAAALEGYGPALVHQMKAATVSLTQATERGTLYSLAEIKALSDTARRAGLKVHMDGARFANALVKLGCSPAEMTWKAGVDAVSFGTTKNGTMMAEAVIIFDKTLAEELRIRHKRAGFLHSKMRYFSSQLIAYVKDDLWLDNARRANTAALRIADRFAATPGFDLAFLVQTNQIFAHIAPAASEKLKAADFSFRSWSGARPHLHRLVMSYADSPEMLTRLEGVLAQIQQDS